MKLSRVLYVLAAGALPQLARADAPLSPQALGALQGVVDFCAKADPKDSKQLAQQAALLERGLSAKTIAADKKTDAYKQAYQTLGTVLKEWPADQAAQNCWSVAVVAKPGKPPRPRPEPEIEKPTHSHGAPPPTGKTTQSRSAPRPEIEKPTQRRGLQEK
jgi:hypothetical protein